MPIFIYICQAPPRLQFKKKLNNWNSEKVYLVIYGCLLVVYGRLLLVSGRLLVVCGRLLEVCGGLLVISDSLCLFVVVCLLCLF